VFTRRWLQFVLRIVTTFIARGVPAKDFINDMYAVSVVPHQLFGSPTMKKAIQNHVAAARAILSADPGGSASEGEAGEAEVQHSVCGVCDVCIRMMCVVCVVCGVIPIDDAEGTGLGVL